MKFQSAFETVMLVFQLQNMRYNLFCIVQVKQRFILAAKFKDNVDKLYVKYEAKQP